MQGRLTLRRKLVAQRKALSCWRGWHGVSRDGCGGDQLRFIVLPGNRLRPTSVSPDGLTPCSSGMTATGSHVYFYSLRGAQPQGKPSPRRFLRMEFGRIGACHRPYKASPEVPTAPHPSWALPMPPSPRGRLWVRSPTFLPQFQVLNLPTPKKFSNRR